MKDTTLPKLLYTVPEVKKILMVSEECVRDLIRKGHLRALKLGRLKVTHEELQRFLTEGNGKTFEDLDNVKELSHVITIT